MTGLQYRYVGVIGVGDRGKKKTEKNRVGFSGSFLGQPKNRLQKVGFRSGKTEKN